MRTRSAVVGLVTSAALAIAGGAAFVAAPASAAPGQTLKGATITLYVGPDPTPNDPTTGSVQPPVGPPLSVPGTCPFDINAVFTITGNAVSHSTGNNNGFWMGETINGAATLTDPGNAAFDAPYTGQATGWTGFGTNQSLNDTTGQAETGQTFHFHGTNTLGQKLDVKIDWHFTENNSGTITAVKVVFSCS
jgi:hypothetical protein